MFLINFLQFLVNRLIIRFLVNNEDYNRAKGGDQYGNQWNQPYPDEPYPFPSQKPPCPSQKPPEPQYPPPPPPKPQQPPCPSQQYPGHKPDYPSDQYPVNPPLDIQIPTDDAYCCGCQWLKYCNCCGENCTGYLQCCQNWGCANCCQCDCISNLVSCILNPLIQAATCNGCDINCAGNGRDSSTGQQRSDNNPFTLKGCDGCSGCDCCMTSSRAIDTIEVTTNSTNNPFVGPDPMSSGSGSHSGSGSSSGWDCCGCGCDFSSLFSLLYNSVLSAVIASPLGLMAFIREITELFRRSINLEYVHSKRYVTTGDSLKRHGGKVAVITYGNEGIGAQMAKVLARLGFRVIIGAKEAAVGQLPTDSKQIKVLKLDLSSFDSVREFAKEVTKSEDKIDLLINSANDFEEQNILTKDGIEKSFSENYLGHFLLTNMLINKLKKAENGRIVNVSSIAHYLGYIDYNTVTNKDPSHSGLRAYAQSKLAVVLFTRELSKRIIDTNMSVYVVSPEIIQRRGSFRSNPFDNFLAKISDPVNGIQTLLYVSLDEELKNESGFYYNSLKKVYPLMTNASDDNESVNLWNRSEKLVKLEDEYKLIRGKKTSQTAEVVSTNAANAQRVIAAEEPSEVAEESAEQSDVKADDNIKKSDEEENKSESRD